MELMLALFLASLLSVSLLTVYYSVKRRYQMVSTLINLQENGRFAVTLMRRKIHGATRGAITYTLSTLPRSLKYKLKSLSDVLVLRTQQKQHEINTAYYISWTSWRQHGNKVKALFEKPLSGRRRELVSFVTGFSAQLEAQGVRYTFKLSAETAVLKIDRTWHGFALLPARDGHAPKK